MNIEFHCARCDTTISTRAGAADKFVRCPACGGELQTSPSPAVPPPPIQTTYAPTPPPRELSAERPIAPIPVPSLRPPPRIERGSARTTARSNSKLPAKPPFGRIAFGHTIACTGTVFWKNKVRLLLAALVVVAVLLSLPLLSYLLAVAGYFVGSVIAGFPRNGSWLTTTSAVLSCLVAGGVAVFGYSWFEAGWTLFFVRLARGEPCRISDLFRGAPGVWSLFGFNLLRVFMHALLAALIGIPQGMLLVSLKLGYRTEDQLMIPILATSFLIPYLVVGLFLYLTPYFIVDRKLGMCGGMAASWRHMRGSKGILVGIYLVVGSISGAFIVLTCALGSLAVLPFFMLMSAVAYTMATGQPLAAGLGSGVPPPLKVTA